MTEKQSELPEELRLALTDMAGGVLALESFLCCRSSYEARLGKQISNEWLRRLADYLHQHVRETAQLTDSLLHDTANT